MPDTAPDCLGFAVGNWLRASRISLAGEFARTEVGPALAGAGVESYRFRGVDPKTRGDHV